MQCKNGKTSVVTRSGSSSKASLMCWLADQLYTSR
jgi:hypothetical protein